MPKLRILTWNICGDKQARVENAMEVIDKQKPDIMLFQEARKTKPDSSNLYTSIATLQDFAFLPCNEYEKKGLQYGNQNFYPDTTGKCYYGFIRSVVKKVAVLANLTLRDLY